MRMNFSAWKDILERDVYKRQHIYYKIHLQRICRVSEMNDVGECRPESRAKTRGES